MNQSQKFQTNLMNQSQNFLMNQYFPTFLNFR
jgi:hypothetical protein